MFQLPRGDSSKALAESEIVVEAEYRTQVQTHVPMETHAAYLAGALVGVVAHWATAEDLRTREAALAFWRLFRVGSQDAHGE